MVVVVEASLVVVEWVFLCWTMPKILVATWWTQLNSVTGVGVNVVWVAHQLTLLVGSGVLIA